MKRVGVVVVALVALSAGVAPAGEKRERQNRIANALNQADAAVIRADRGCRLGRPSLKPSFTDAPPSDAMLQTLGILRREQTPAEAKLTDERRPPLGFPFTKGIHRQHVRIARSAEGRRFLIFVARDSFPFKARPERCLAKRKRVFKRLIADENGAFRRQALRLLARFTRQENRLRGLGPQEGVFVTSRGGGSGGASAADIQERGVFSSLGRSGRRTVVNGLVPDPVATVEAVWPRRSGSRRRGPYKRVIRRTTEVRDNVLSFEVPRDAGDALGLRMIWRDAEGQLVRRVPSSRGGSW